MNYFSGNLLFLRKNFDKTQSELAFDMNKGQTTIGNWESGKSEPNFDELIQISNIFDISIHELLLSDLKNVHLTEKGKGVAETAKSTPLSTPNSTPKGQNQGKNYTSNEAKTTVEEEESLNTWVIMGQLRKMDEKLDLLRVLAQEQGAKKK